MSLIKKGHILLLYIQVKLSVITTRVQNNFLTAKFSPVHLIKINSPIWCGHYLEGRS